MIKRGNGNVIQNEKTELAIELADCMADLSTKNFTLMVNEILKKYPDCRPVIRIAIHRRKFRKDT